MPKAPFSPLGAPKLRFLMLPRSPGLLALSEHNSPSNPEAASSATCMSADVFILRSLDDC
jgi:hypothetical protein